MAALEGIVSVHPRSRPHGVVQPKNILFAGKLARELWAKENQGLRFVLPTRFLGRPSVALILGKAAAQLLPESSLFEGSPRNASALLPSSDFSHVSSGSLPGSNQCGRVSPFQETNSSLQQALVSQSRHRGGGRATQPLQCRYTTGN